jgi:hypothetical protein
MHPLVRDLYKRVLHVGRDYPLGLEWVRRKSKAWFRQNAALQDEVAIKRAVHEGRFWVREMKEVIAIKKYRHLKRTYGQHLG